MAFSSTLKGRGTIVIDGVEYGDAAYQLSVRTDRHGWKSADGTIETDASAIRASFDSNNAAIVRLPNGEEVQLIITRWNSVSNSAEVKASGKVPGM